MNFSCCTIKSKIESNFEHFWNVLVYNRYRLLPNSVSAWVQAKYWGEKISINQTIIENTFAAFSRFSWKYATNVHVWALEKFRRMSIGRMMIYNDLEVSCLKVDCVSSILGCLLVYKTNRQTPKKRRVYCFFLFHCRVSRFFVTFRFLCFLSVIEIAKIIPQQQQRSLCYFRKQNITTYKRAVHNKTSPPNIQFALKGFFLWLIHL